MIYVNLVNNARIIIAAYLIYKTITKITIYMKENKIKIKSHIPKLIYGNEVFF